MSGRPKDCATETFEKARSIVYNLPSQQVRDSNNKPVYQLDRAYEDDATETAAEQLAKAGMRLALVLNDALQWTNFAAVHGLRALASAANGVSHSAISLANGGLGQHHRQDSEGISPEIGNSGWRSSVRRSTSPIAWHAGRMNKSQDVPAMIAVSIVG
jgi:hypothetical protein